MSKTPGCPSASGHIVVCKTACISGYSNRALNSGAHAQDKIRAQYEKSKDHGVIAVHPDGNVVISPKSRSKTQM